MFRKIYPCRALDSVSAGAKIDLVKVKLEDLFFGIIPFKLNCEEQFFDLPG